MAVVLITDASNEVGGLDGAKITKIVNEVIRNASTDYRYYDTCFQCSDYDDDWRARFHRYCLNATVVGVVRMERSYDKFSILGTVKCGVIRFILDNCDPVFLDVAMSLIERWWIPCQKNVGRVKSYSTGVTWQSTGC